MSQSDSNATSPVKSTDQLIKLLLDSQSLSTSTKKMRKAKKQQRQNRKKGRR